jgi:PiT family inorganic phosphate transporter
VSNSGNLGVAIVAVLAAAAGLSMYAASRRRPVTAENVNDYPTESVTPA